MEREGCGCGGCGDTRYGVCSYCIHVDHEDRKSCSRKCCLHGELGECGCKSFKTSGITACPVVRGVLKKKNDLADEVPQRQGLPEKIHDFDKKVIRRINHFHNQKELCITFVSKILDDEYLTKEMKLRIIGKLHTILSLVEAKLRNE